MNQPGSVTTNATDGISLWWVDGATNFADPINQATGVSNHLHLVDADGYQGDHIGAHWWVGFNNPQDIHSKNNTARQILCRCESSAWSTSHTHTCVCASKNKSLCTYLGARHVLLEPKRRISEDLWSSWTWPAAGAAFETSLWPPFQLGSDKRSIWVTVMAI